MFYIFIFILLLVSFYIFFLKEILFFSIILYLYLRLHLKIFYSFFNLKVTRACALSR